jgi:hypothetical protein
MATVNTNTTRAHDAQVIVGVQKHLLNVPSLPLAGCSPPSLRVAHHWLDLRRTAIHPCSRSSSFS